MLSPSAERMIHDRARQAVVLDQNERVADGRGLGREAPAFSKAALISMAIKRFVLNNEDRAPPKSGVLHGGTYARLSANARGGLFLVGRRVPSRRSILDAQQA